MIKLSSLCPTRPGWNIPGRTAHLREPDLHIKLRVVIGHASTRPFGRGPWSGLLLNLAPDTLRLSDEEPPPTCPFILTNNVKERKTPTPLALPLLRGLAEAPGDLVTAAVATGRTGVRRCGVIHLGGSLGAVNAFLQFFGTDPKKAFSGRHLPLGKPVARPSSPTLVNSPVRPSPDTTRPAPSPERAHRSQRFAPLFSGSGRVCRRGPSPAPARLARRVQAGRGVVGRQ